MKSMSHKIEIAALILAGIASSFTQDLISKTAITIISMVIGTTVAYYWREYLEKKNKNKNKDGKN